MRTKEQILATWKDVERSTARNAARTAHATALMVEEAMSGIYTARAAHNVRDARQFAQYAQEDAKIAADRRKNLRTIAIHAARAAAHAAETTLILRIAQEYAERMRRRDARNAARRDARNAARRDARNAARRNAAD